MERSLALISRGKQPGMVFILDTMHNVATAWSSVTAEIIQHCFQKSSFWSTVEINEKYWTADKENLHQVMPLAGAAGFKYDRYVIVDDAAMTSKP
ncbi:hypothetical protein HPB49_003193 [Dermacentor silvarum]|uniref:Uncharacterized protein n=1 Tax=Dermacentor silvarum TaxID=543639 RepID=A0ACB8DTU9_DERSI|nr:hypothetical protein HPB49_003193 [Dermacentor silvarum]